MKVWKRKRTFKENHFWSRVFKPRH